MARNLTTDMKLEIAKEVISPVFLVTMAFDDGDLNLWTGYGDLVWNSTTFTGTGTLLGIDRIEEAADLRAVGVNFTMSGVPAELRSIALDASANIQGGEVTVWVGLRWKSNGGVYGLVADPHQVFKGRMDVMTVRDDGRNCTIQLSAESVLVDLERPRRRTYTPEDQAVDYTGDTFFDYVAGLQDKTIEWGRT